MDSFYLIVLSVATLILIILLAFLGWTMSNSKKGTKFPTITTSCPDNWQLDTSTKDSSGKPILLCKRPESGYNVGSDTATANLTTYMTTRASIGYNDADRTKLNFTDNVWNTDSKVPDPVCAKKAWAKKYSIAWDSIENANYCD